MADAERSSPVLNQIGREFAAALGATGALGTLFYVGGVLSQNTYFWTFGARWLSREIAAGDIYHGIFELLPSAIVLPIAIVLTLRLKPSSDGMRLIGHGATFFLITGILAVACDKFAGRFLSWHARSAVDFLAVVLFSIAIGCVTSVALAHSAVDRSFSLPSAGTALVALMILFVGIPFLLGRARALADIAAPKGRLPHALIDGSRDLPVIATGADRVYCLQLQRGAAIPTVIVIKWDRIGAISPPAEQSSSGPGP